MPIYQLGNRVPRIHPTAYVATEAVIIGDVVLEEHVSIWPGAVLRGDADTISIGAGSNVQDGSVLHADAGFPCTLGLEVVVGHQVMLHGCTIGDSCLIGMQAVILNGATVGAQSLVGAGALITQNKSFRARSMLVGTPARVARELTDAEVERIRGNAAEYIERGRRYKQELVRIG